MRLLQLVLRINGNFMYGQIRKGLRSDLVRTASAEAPFIDNRYRNDNQHVISNYRYGTSIDRYS